ncbi:roadblock/LC7 domain-containing protein [Micromonospora sp. NPDC000207]|uniref:roadblock/LC7 domain-containing protein n=1 Tax=Micromonospora sp. NPDC000207 TaxID=3154246 RepID=UPI0033290A57
MKADAVLVTELQALRRRRPEINGGVLAGTDGLLIASDLPATDATHLAAISAASFGLGQRMADTVDRSEFQDFVLATSKGWVVVCPAGLHALFTLVTGPTDDLTRLRGEAREVADRAGSAFDAHRTGVAAVQLTQGYGPLAMRTPMATLPTQLRRTRPPAWRRPPV